MLLKQIYHWQGLQNILKSVCSGFSKKVLPQLAGPQMKMFLFFLLPDINRSHRVPANSAVGTLLIWRTSLAHSIQVPWHSGTHSRRALLLILSILGMSSLSNSCWALSIFQMFTIMSFRALLDCERRKFARSFLQAAFWLWSWTNNSVSNLMLLATRNSDTSKFVRHVILLALLLCPASSVEFLFWSCLLLFDLTHPVVLGGAISSRLGWVGLWYTAVSDFVTYFYVW